VLGLSFDQSDRRRARRVRRLSKMKTTIYDAFLPGVLAFLRCSITWWGETYYFPSLPCVVTVRLLFCKSKEETSGKAKHAVRFE